MCTPRHRPPLRGVGQVGLPAEDGMTLVEVMVAVTILAVALLAVASTVIASLGSLVESRQRQAAYTAASRSIELVRSYAWDEVALRSGDAAVTATAFDPESGTIDAPGSGETIVRTAGGRVAGAPHQTDDGTRRVRTYVTAFVDPRAPDAEQRRVTVVVEWRRGQRRESLRESTIISRARWGVAQPSFALSPADGHLAVERSRRDCLTHTITNRGSRDRYAVAVPTTATTPPLAQYDLVTVHEDRNRNGAPDPGETIAPGATTRELEFGASTDLLICYRAGASATADVRDAPVATTSQLEPDKAQQAVHTVVLERERLVYLRRSQQDGISETSSAAPAEALADVDGDGLPGLRLPRTGPGSSAVRWRVPFAAARSVRGVQLRLWTATPGALDGSLTSPASQTLHVVVRRVDAGGAAGSTLASGDVPVNQTTGGWAAREWSATVAATEIAAGEQLELAVACAPTSATDCLLAFDATAHPSALRVLFP